MPLSDTTEFARHLRAHSLRMVHAANASHIGSCLSMADMLAVLYAAPILRFKANEPHWPQRDRLFVSKGHAAAVVYAALAEAGYFPAQWLEDYTKNGSLLQGHVSHHVPGVELSTGSLGHAMGVACGLAIAALRALENTRMFVIVSDGELDEGSNWEAILFAGHHGLRNLTVIVDYNQIQSFGSVSDVLELAPLADKFRAFHWDVHEVNGHDHAALHAALATPHATKPSIVIAHTIKGKGVSFMEGKLEWHYKSPSAELLKQALAEVEGA